MTVAPGATGGIEFIRKVIDKFKVAGSIEHINAPYSVHIEAYKQNNRMIIQLVSYDRTEKDEPIIHKNIEITLKSPIPVCLQCLSPDKPMPSLEINGKKRRSSYTLITNQNI